MPSTSTSARTRSDGVRVHHSQRSKHSMRKSPYLVSLFFLLAATSLTLLNIHTADLVRVIVRDPGPTAFEAKYGLYQRCARSVSIPELLQPAPAPLMSPADMPTAPPSHDLMHRPRHGKWKCDQFPSRSECEKFGEGFCVQWSTAGYAAQLALIPCLAALVSLLFIFLHRGKKSSRARARRKQWKLVSGAMLVHCILQATSVAFIVNQYRVDDRFKRGARLGHSFLFGTAAALTSGVTFVFLTYIGMAARRGEPWAAGRSSRPARRHKRTNSGRVVPVPGGTHIPPHQIVTVGEVVAASEHEADEHTALLAGELRGPAGGGKTRATDGS